MVENVNVHDDIKTDLPTRDQFIENDMQGFKNLAGFGVKVICYNFMPVFDRTRADLLHSVIEAYFILPFTDRFDDATLRFCPSSFFMIVTNKYIYNLLVSDIAISVLL